MIRIVFEKDAKGNAVCSTVGREPLFALNQEPFSNRVCRFYGDTLLFDGYSIWFESEGKEAKPEGNFSMSFLVSPAGYSAGGDGLFSCFDMVRREGFYVRLKKHGKVEAGFGNGHMLFTFESINAHVKKGRWNAVTVVFWQDAGWCDLYINGIMSNRKQFPRHMPIRWPEHKAYLGRYVDYEAYREEPVFGMYYGLMKEFSVHSEAFHAEQIKTLHNGYTAGKPTEPILPDRSVYAGDVQRPQYHLIAPEKWMNEPHAPLYFEGCYHLFYQANPHGPVWDNIQWGHVISQDMVHWKDLPLALETGMGELDPDGCWSGSSLIDKDGIPRIFYTAGNDSRFPNQFVATASAVVDEERRLEQWEKCSDPVAVQSEGWFGEFRDPFVWLEDGEYFMLVGSGDADNGGGNAILYSSADGKDWQSHGFLIDYDYEENPELGHVFELPVLLPLRDESGAVVCHIFLMCACQIEGEAVENYAFLGKWEPKARRFQSFYDKPMLLDLGGGVFTGPSGFVTPDKRTVVFTIAQGMRGGRENIYAGWAHNGGLPVELSMRNHTLHIQPIRELESLQSRKLLHLQDVSVEEANKALSEFFGNRFRMRISAVAQSLSVEAGDLTQDFWAEAADGRCSRMVYYDQESGRFGVTDENGQELGKYRGEVDKVVLEDGPVCMDCFLDHSMLEVYLNGQKAITQRNYIRGRERMFRIGGTVERILELELWEMDSAY